MKALIAAALVLATGCASSALKLRGGFTIDHIILAAPTLAEGTAEFERMTGVKPTIGGEHPGRGTENALVSLGGRSYLEIIAPHAGAKSDLPDVTKLTPIGWAVRVDYVDDARTELQRAGFTTTEPKAGSRVTPAGQTLKWTTFDITQPRIDTAPFFIRWSEPLDHPSRNAASGCRLRELRLADPNDPSLHELLVRLALTSVRTQQAAKPAMQVQLVCRTGEVLFTSE